MKASAHFVRTLEKGIALLAQKYGLDNVQTWTTWQIGFAVSDSCRAGREHNARVQMSLDPAFDTEWRTLKDVHIETAIRAARAAHTQSHNNNNEPNTPKQMSTKTTYVLFKRSGQNVKNNGPLYEAMDAIYATKEEARAKMIGFAADDYNAFTDDDGNLPGIMDKGAMSYEHDSRDYSYIAIEDLDENDAAVALKSSRISDNEKAGIYALHPDLK